MIHRNFVTLARVPPAEAAVRPTLRGVRLLPD